MSIGTLTLSSFAGHVGEEFSATGDQGTATSLRLVEAVASGRSRVQGSVETPGAEHAIRAEPFSLVFVGVGSTMLPQGTYRLAHADVGTHDIFLVPIGPDVRGWRYQAVFN